MKKVIIAMMMVGAMATVEAEQYFSIVNTVAYAAKDTSPSDAHASYYSGYLCTIESAAELFGGKTTAAAISTYVAANYKSVVKSLADEAGGGDVYALSADVEGYSYGQYGVSAYTTAALSGSYVALLLYSDGKNNGFRAFGSGSSSAVGGGVVFDDDGSGVATSTIGAWGSPQVVPEPASGVLLLLGLAGLALKRKMA